MAKRKRLYGAEKEESQSTSKIYKVAMYARLSVDREERKAESIETQLDIMRQYVADHPELKNYKEYIDKGYSGTTFKRPAFEEMMTDVKEGRINVIIVKDLSRFGRNDLETSNYLETILPFMQVRFISVNDNYDSYDAVDSGKALEIALKNLVNDMYAKDISRKVYSSRRSDMEQGVFLGREAPYGYKINKDDKKRHFLIDEPAAEVVRKIFQMALDGDSVRDIATTLTDEGYAKPGDYKKTGKLMIETDSSSVETKQKRNEWYFSTISSILNNKAYIGMLVQGRRVAKLFEGEKRHKNDEENWISIPDAHPAIISEEDFNKVHEILDRKAADSTFNGDSGKRIQIKDNKYKGILYCGECGRMLQMASEVRTRKGKKYRNYYFQCVRGDSDSKSRACGVRITEATLDRLLYNSLCDIAGELTNSDDISKYVEKMNVASDSLDAEYQKKRQYISQSIKGIRNDMADDFRKYAEDTISRYEYSERQHSNQESIDNLEDKLAELDKRYEDSRQQLNSLNRWCKAFLSGRRWKKIKLDEELLRILVKEVRVYSGHVLEVDIPIGNPSASYEIDTKSAAFISGGEEAI